MWNSPEVLCLSALDGVCIWVRVRESGRASLSGNMSIGSLLEL